jgi:hypothetical protein
MERLIKDVPGSRRLFRSVDDFTVHDYPIVIPCSRRRRRMRWVIAIALIAGLWGFAMTSQLASQGLLHQGVPVVGHLSQE